MSTTIIRMFLLTLVGSLAIGLVGCGGAAWQVRRGDWSGEIALHGPITEAHHAAEDRMIEHCHGRARIVQGAEAERVAIADASAVAPHEVSVDHGGRRMHYVCVGRAPAAFRGRPSAPVEMSARASTPASGL